MSDRDFDSQDGGYLKVMNELADKLMTYELTKIEHRVLWMFFRVCYGFNNSTCDLRWKDMTDFTGLADGSLSKAINRLKERNILHTFQTESKQGVTYKINSKISTWKQVLSKRKDFPNGMDLLHKRKVNASQTESVPLKTVKTKDSSRHPDKLDDHCPHENIKQLYHNILPELPKVRVWTQTRRANLKARWNQKHKTESGRISNTIEFWEGLFKYIRGSKFLMGQTPGRNGGASFAASLDWIIKSENFAKVIEGKYH